jgi:hypothetical protein
LVYSIKGRTYRLDEYSSIFIIWPFWIQIWKQNKLTPNFALELKFMLLGIFNDFYHILLESTIESTGLKSFFHVEMNIRNSKTEVRMLYKNNFMQLYNKNGKINVWFYSHLKLLSVIQLSVNGKRHYLNKVPAILS